MLTALETNMKTIAFYNNKGGIGKTTFSVHTTLFASLRRIKSLAVGLDRQGDLCRWLARGDAQVQDGLAFRRGEFLDVIYSPMELPAKLKGYELVVADCPPAVEIVDKVSADLWVVPLDGRLAIENMGNIYPHIRQAKCPILIVVNRADLIGKTARENLLAAARGIDGAILYAKPIPCSAAIAKAAEYQRAVWEVPYGRGTQGDEAVQALCAEILRQVGLAERL